ncbi:MAG: tetratricopeptide repeat protein [Hyphomicrobiales bacterium]
MIKAERVPDQEAIFANLNDFAPELLALTRVTPHDLAHIKHDKPLSKGQQCLSIILKRIPDETKFKCFRAKGPVERRAFELIAERFYDRLFAAPDPFHELIEAKLDTNIELSQQTNLMVQKLLARASNEDALSAENENLKQQLAEALAALGRQNDPSSQDAEDELIAGDPEKAKAFFRERAEAQEGVIGDAAKDAAQNYRHLGAVAFLNDTQEALHAYGRATELDPEDASGWTQLAHLLHRVGEIDKAMEAHKQVLEIGERTSNQDSIAVASGNLGNLYDTRGDLDNAEKMYIKSFELYKELGRKDGMANQYGNLGILNKNRGDLDAAEKMYIKSFELFQELGRKDGIANQYGNLGNLYQLRDDLGHAEEMHKKSLEIDEKLGRKEGIASAFGSLGIICKTRGELDEADEMFKKSLKINEELERKEGMASQYGNLGILCAARGDFDTAISYWTKSLTLARAMGAARLVQRVEGLFTDCGLDIPKD